MRKRVYLVLSALLFAMACFAAWVGMREQEPVYHGKSLSEWLGEATKDDPCIPMDPKDKPAAMNAVRSMGTNALPSLIRMIEAEDSPTKLKLLTFARQHSLMRSYALSRAQKQNIRAVFGFCALGTKGNSAVPALMDAYVKRGGFCIPVALANMSGEGVQALSQALTNSNIILTNKVPRIRFEIISALGQRGALAHNADVRPERLVRLEQDAKIAAPSLLQCLNDPDVFIRITAAQALVDLGTDRDRAVAVFASALTDLNWRARQQSAFYLFKLGPAAASAVPTLVKALQDKNEMVRQVVTKALDEIGSGTATNAFIHTNLPGL